MKIYLARHGETDWNLNDKIQGRSDVPLNKTGLEQARKLGEELRGIKFDKIYVSTLRRAKETAEVALREAGIEAEIELDEGLVERNYGEFEGKKGEEFDFPKYWDFELDSGERGVESIRTMFERGKRAAEKIKAEVPEEGTVLVVAHGGFLKALYFNLVGYEIGKTEFRDFHLDNGEVKEVEVGNSSNFA